MTGKRQRQGRWGDYEQENTRCPPFPGRRRLRRLLRHDPRTGADAGMDAGRQRRARESRRARRGVL